MKKIYNYVVVFKGQMSEGVGKFMTETMARAYLESILKGAKLNDITFSVKRLTPEPALWSDLGSGVTASEGFTLTGNTVSFDQ